MVARIAGGQRALRDMAHYLVGKARRLFCHAVPKSFPTLTREPPAPPYRAGIEPARRRTGNAYE